MTVHEASDAVIDTGSYTFTDSAAMESNASRYDGVGLQSATAGVARDRGLPKDRESESWLPLLESRLSRMTYMRTGWDGYGAVPPSALAVATARELLVISSEVGIQPAKVAPSVVGGVAIVFRFDV